MTAPEKTRMGVAKTISGLEIDMQISPEAMLLATYKKMLGQLQQAMEIEGMQAMEDHMVEIRLSVVAQPEAP